MSKETCWIGISLGRDNAALSTTAVVIIIKILIFEILLYNFYKNKNLLI